MFVVVFQGSPADAELMRPPWSDGVAGCGCTGAVGGFTTEGEWVGVLQFPTEAATDEPRALLPPAFADASSCFGSTEVEEVMAGWPPPNAEFVQVMLAGVTDRKGWAEVDAVGVPRFAAMRPDFLGSIRIWQPGDRLMVVDSFTSEAEARAGEAIPPPTEDQPIYEAWFSYLTDIAWYDLVDPWRD